MTSVFLTLKRSAEATGRKMNFCNRAEQAGYHHVMCDDTFVYHKGTASFDTEEKKKLLEEHEAILNDRYAARCG